MKIFLICPVRNATEEQKVGMAQYIKSLENAGNAVYYPARDTDQRDKIGYKICTDNRMAIEEADEVHIFYDDKSSGSLFDMGMAFALKKSLVLANRVNQTDGKSFNNMVIAWSSLK